MLFTVSSLLHLADAASVCASDHIIFRSFVVSDYVAQVIYLHSVCLLLQVVCTV